MAREKTVFRCTSCGAQSPKWAGQCASCGEWNSLEQEGASAGISPRTKTSGKAIDFSRIQKKAAHTRLSSGFSESDQVLGGGFLSDSLTLLVGNPGIGKSTFALHAAISIAQEHSDRSVFILSGEESSSQILQRCGRIAPCPPNLKISSAFAIEDVLATCAQEKPLFLVIDSVQTFSHGDLPNAPGSLPQIKAVTESLMHLAKQTGVPVLLVGQVNKGGDMAGPQALAHLVDTVLQFEGDDQHELRMLRSLKNRFGSTSEVGIFEMTEKGLAEVKNPSAAFLEGRLAGGKGSAIFPALEGQRPFLVEIQALTAASPFGIPKRSSSGISLQRLSILLAVLEQHARLPLANRDVFANVVGGFRLEETASDLAVALAVVSAQRGSSLPSDMVIIGELGLSGEVRSVHHLEKRLQEAEKLGFTQAIIPKTKQKKKTKMALLEVRTLSEAISQLHF